MHNGHQHDHDKLMEGRKRMLSDEMIAYIDQLFEKDVTRYDPIIKFIEEERTKNKVFIGEPNPERRQIEYRLKLYRNSEIKPIINLGDLMKWCNDNESFPNNDNDAFVLGHECSSISQEMNFRFCLSTPLLLKKFIRLKTTCIDATYKLNYNGFPLIVFGTVDRQKRFHPLCMRVPRTKQKTTTVLYSKL